MFYIPHYPKSEVNICTCNLIMESYDVGLQNGGEWEILLV